MSSDADAEQRVRKIVRNIVTAYSDHPYFADDGDEGRCECGYQWYPKGGPVSQRHEQGFEAATSALRAWLAMETVSGPNVVAELRYWLDYWGGTEKCD